MLVEVKNQKALNENGIFFTTGTLYKWHCTGQNAFIFRKVGSKLFIHLEEWQKLIDESGKKEKQKAEKYEQLKGNG
jgi:hypothetical protein